MPDNDNIYLQIRIERSDPMLVEDLGLALQSLSYIYDENTQLHGEGGKAKIYIGRISEGSIDIEIISKIADSVANIFGLKKIVESIKKGVDSEEKLSEDSKNRKNNTHIQNLAKTIFGNPTNKITLNVHNGDKIEYHLHFDGNTANEIMKNESQPVQKIAEDIYNKTFKEQAFRWDQAGRSRKVDRGFIDNISLDAVKVIFDDNDIRHQMLKNDPFERGFIVDVEVYFVGTKPKFYKIVELHAAVDNNREVKKIPPRT